MNPGSAAEWGQFGLAGLVIFALFVALIVIVKWLVTHIDKKDEHHKEERNEWKATVVTSNDKIEGALHELSSSLREMSRR